MFPLRRLKRLDGTDPLVVVLFISFLRQIEVIASTRLHRFEACEKLRL